MAVNPVTVTPVSSCALLPLSLLSATSFQVAVHAGVPEGFTRYLYCQLYSVNSVTTPVSGVQLRRTEVDVGEVVLAVGRVDGSASDVRVAETRSEKPLTPEFSERICM